MFGEVLVFRDITLYKRLERRLSWEAAHDPLTKLPNRTLFREALERALARAKKQDSLIAVLFLDLDWFKLVNDNFGHFVVHLVGDQLLVAAARRIKACLRPNDIVGRLGGDEFAVLLEEIKEAGDVKPLAERIKGTLKRPFHLAGKEVFVSVSIGIVISSNVGDQAEDFLHNADRAMYRVKALNKTECRLCEASVIARSPVPLESVVDLQRALDQREFIIDYQPILSLASGNLTGVEALLRWNHPQRWFACSERIHSDGRGDRADCAHWRVASADGLCSSQSVANRGGRTREGGGQCFDPPTPAHRHAETG